MVRKSDNNEFKAFFLRALFAPPYFIRKIVIRKNTIVLIGLFKKYEIKINKLSVKRYKDPFDGPADTFVFQYNEKRFLFDDFYFKGSWSNALSKRLKIWRNYSKFNPSDRTLLSLSSFFVFLLLAAFLETGNLFVLGVVIIISVFLIRFLVDPYR
ncbi:MAG: hypothetical protein CVV21_04480 [Candidatus Goldiibacteriota bacterium HGW-Goldbacteria-1]|jgi:hypothetical protein|nr:MAG: hypothetical protein CVV21_04480 [Candidatus Goldiibacteriota bacterium HGW-Goldbacteria-1]